LANTNHRTMIGGQAVIEGVMMRGVRKTAMAVRKPDGSISMDIWENTSIKDKYPVLKIPVIRGVVGFVEMLIFGYKSLMASAEVAESAYETEQQAVAGDAGGTPVETIAEPQEKKKASKAVKATEIGSMLLGLVVAVLLFSVAPAYLTQLTGRFVNYGAFKTLVEGLVRIAIFVLYLFVISRMKDIRRVYEYHGAEHKTIYCYEHGEELTAENARKYTRLHPRCGTSFLLIVLIVSILVFSLFQVTWSNILLRIVIKLALLPLIVGISYEIIKFAGRHDNSVMRFVLAPGLWMQKLTTREPDDSQLEVAISSLKAVLTDNSEDDKW
jgi:uncharacterized protein YqhQ